MQQAICTGVARILHLILVPNSFNSNINYGIFFSHIWHGTNLLGFAHDKEMRIDLLSHWIWRDSSRRGLQLLAIIVRI
jgi:hypothetical protein